LFCYVQIDKWIFEVKSVRVDDFGKPYFAVANVVLNGKSAYIDGLLTREDDDFKRDYYTNLINLVPIIQ
jgi:hypothetical protein